MLADVANEAILFAGLGGSGSTQGGSFRILLVDDLVPDPLFGAGYPRAFAIVRTLVGAGFNVDYYPMQATREDIRRMTASFSGAVHFYRGRGQRGLRRLLNGKSRRYDILLVSRPRPMRALLAAQASLPGRTPLVPVVYDAEAVIAPREKLRRALFGPAWSDAEYETALHAELKLAGEAQAITTVGPHDAALIASVVDRPTFVLPHPVSIRTGGPDFDARRDILFVGRLTGTSAEIPNVDSVEWFAKQVMPLLDRLIGADYRFHIAGRIDSCEVEVLASERILLHGVVENLEPLYDCCRLFVAPTRYAAGIPLKVVEAMAEGIPCVSTTLLARQLAADPDALPHGETAESFAKECARLYTQRKVWGSVRAAAWAHVGRSASPEAFDHNLAAVLNYVISAAVATT